MSIVVGFEMFGDRLHVSIAAYETWKSDRIERVVSQCLIDSVTKKVKTLVEQKVIPKAQIRVNGETVKLLVSE